MVGEGREKVISHPHLKYPPVPTCPSPCRSGDTLVANGQHLPPTSLSTPCTNPRVGNKAKPLPPWGPVLSLLSLFFLWAPVPGSHLCFPPLPTATSPSPCPSSWPGAHHALRAIGAIASDLEFPSAQPATCLVGEGQSLFPFKMLFQLLKS